MDPEENIGLSPIFPDHCQSFEKKNEESFNLPNFEDSRFLFLQKFEDKKQKPSEKEDTFVFNKSFPHKETNASVIVDPLSYLKSLTKYEDSYSHKTYPDEIDRIMPCEFPRVWDCMTDIAEPVIHRRNQTSRRTVIFSDPQRSHQDCFARDNDTFYQKNPSPMKSNSQPLKDFSLPVVVDRRSSEVDICGHKTREAEASEHLVYSAKPVLCDREQIFDNCDHLYSTQKNMKPIHQYESSRRNILYDNNSRNKPNFFDPSCSCQNRNNFRDTRRYDDPISVSRDAPRDMVVDRFHDRRYPLEQSSHRCIYDYNQSNRCNFQDKVNHLRPTSRKFYSPSFKENENFFFCKPQYELQKYQPIPISCNVGCPALPHSSEHILTTSDAAGQQRSSPCCRLVCPSSCEPRLKDK